MQLPLALVAFNQQQLDAWLPGGALAEFVREGDRLYLVSGNNARPLDIGWVNVSASRARHAYPWMEVDVLTAGLEHVRLLAAAVSDDVRAIGYGYEPNMGNEPEFGWGRATVVSNMTTAAGLIRQAGKEAFAMPTGRAMSPRDHRGEFDYASDIGAHMDRVVVQAQAHCQRHDYAAGVRDVIAQFGGDASRLWFQITVNPRDVNGVTAEHALDCITAAVRERPAGILFWWAVDDLAEARRFLERRDTLRIE